MSLLVGAGCINVELRNVHALAGSAETVVMSSFPRVSETAILISVRGAFILSQRLLPL